MHVGCGAGDELDSKISAPHKPQLEAGQRSSKSFDDDTVLLPLPEGVLARNLGIPVLVVVTKVSS